MDDLFQGPQEPIFTILNFPKKILVKVTSNRFHQKNIWEVLMIVEGIQAISALNRQNLPPPACFRVDKSTLRLSVFSSTAVLEFVIGVVSCASSLNLCDDMTYGLAFAQRPLLDQLVIIWYYRYPFQQLCAYWLRRWRRALRLVSQFFESFVKDLKSDQGEVLNYHFFLFNVVTGFLFEKKGSKIGTKIRGTH